MRPALAHLRRVFWSTPPSIALACLRLSPARRVCRLSDGFLGYLVGERHWVDEWFFHGCFRMNQATSASAGHFDFESVGEEVDWLVACVGGECVDFAEFEFDGAIDASAGHVD